MSKQSERDIRAAGYAFELGRKETLKRLLPKDYYPCHLTTWADSLETEWGYKSTLTAFLRELATNWEALNQPGEE